MNEEFIVPKGDFRGYDHQLVWHGKPNPELTEVGPWAVCGDYLRRHWLPIAMTDQIGDLP